MKFPFHTHFLRDELDEGTDGGGQYEPGATGAAVDDQTADALMAQISRGEEIAPPAAPASTTTQTAPAAGAQAAPAGQAPATPWETDTIKVGGQELKATRAQILQWAAQGRNYPQHIEKIKADTKAEYETKYKTYQEIDAYAQQNPEWWKHVEQSFQNRASQPQTPGTPGSVTLPPEIQAKLDQLDRVVEFQSKSEDQQAQAALDAEVKGIREKYPDLSWDTLDEHGNSLEMRVIDHALKMDIQFGTAFRDLMHDDIVKLNADKAKEAAVKELQAQRKKGVIGVSNTPGGQPPARAQTHKSMEDAAHAAKQELGITG